MKILIIVRNANTATNIFVLHIILLQIIQKNAKIRRAANIATRVEYVTLPGPMRTRADIVTETSVLNIGFQSLTNVLGNLKDLLGA